MGNFIVGESIEGPWSFHLLSGGSLKALCGVECRRSSLEVSDWDVLGTPLERPCLVCQTKAFGWPRILDDQTRPHPLNIAARLLTLYDSLTEIEEHIKPRLLELGNSNDSSIADVNRSYLFAAALLILRKAEDSGVALALNESERLVPRLASRGIMEYEKEKLELLKQLFTELYLSWRRNQ